MSCRLLPLLLTAAATGYVVEAQIPLRDLGAAGTPAPGDDLCLELVLDDRDGAGQNMQLKRLSGNGKADCSTNVRLYWRFRLP